jgi:TPR repeat protein
MKKLLALSALVGALIIGSTMASLADVESGLAAFQKGDYATALQEFRLPAEQGDADAQSFLGYFYANGIGVTKDIKEARKWLRKAAEQGEVKAQYNLALSYDEAQDYKSAVEWYRRAAQQGFVWAQFKLGKKYFHGKGVAVSKKKATKWYRLAAEQGLAAAQGSLGEILLYRSADAVRDQKEGASWLRKAAEQEDVHAQFNLGKAYALGWGVAHDKRNALKWLAKAAEHGHMAAQFMLGEEAEFADKDYRTALKWYRMSAEQGHIAAQFALGKAYEVGKGVAQNNKKAEKWYRMAAEQGYVAAQDKLREINLLDSQDVVQDKLESEIEELFPLINGFDGKIVKLRSVLFDTVGAGGVIQDESDGTTYLFQASDPTLIKKFSRYSIVCHEKVCTVKVRFSMFGINDFEFLDYEEGDVGNSIPLSKFRESFAGHKVHFEGNVYWGDTLEDVTIGLSTDKSVSLYLSDLPKDKQLWILDNCFQKCKAIELEGVTYNDSGGGFLVSATKVEFR